MVFKAVTAYATYRFSLMRSYTISSRMLEGYLSQPYTWFLDRHSAGLGAPCSARCRRSCRRPCCRR